MAYGCMGVLQTCSGSQPGQTIFITILDTICFTHHVDIGTEGTKTMGRKLLEAECESRQGHTVVPCASLAAFHEQPASLKNVPEEAVKIIFMKSPHLDMVF